MVFFKPGQIIEEFTAKNGKKVILRTPRMKDLDQLLKYINSLIEEDTFIGTIKKKTRKEERMWLEKLLKDMKIGKSIGIVAEIDKKIVGVFSVGASRMERSAHIGGIGAGILKEYRGLGIGNKMMEVLIKLGRKMKFKFLRLQVFANNKVAINLYKKFGFKKVARIPKEILYKGKYVDDIIMMKKLK